VSIATAAARTGARPARLDLTPGKAYNDRDADRRLPATAYV